MNTVAMKLEVSCPKCAKFRAGFYLVMYKKSGDGLRAWLSIAMPRTFFGSILKYFIIFQYFFFHLAVKLLTNI